MKWVEVFMDDMIVAEATEEEHDQLLRNIKQRTRAKR